jgi:hypothetical protein
MDRPDVSGYRLVVSAKGKHALFRPNPVGEYAGANPVFQEHAVGGKEGFFVGKGQKIGGAEGRSRQDEEKIPERDELVCNHVPAAKSLAAGDATLEKRSSRLLKVHLLFPDLPAQVVHPLPVPSGKQRQHLVRLANFVLYPHGGRVPSSG